MLKIKRNLKRSPVPNRISDGKGLTKICTESPDLAGIAATVAAFEAANLALQDAFMAAETARQEARQKTTMLREAEQAWNLQFDLLSNSVESVAQGDKSILQGGSLSIYERGYKPKLGKLPEPQNLAAAAGKMWEGTADLTWAKVRGRLVYVVQARPDGSGEDAWKPAATTTRCKVTVKDLEAGKKHWFRVAAIGTAGQSPWSDPALCRAA